MNSASDPGNAGRALRVAIAAADPIRRLGLAAIVRQAGFEIAESSAELSDGIDVVLTTAGDEVVLSTRKGMAIRFSQAQVEFSAELAIEVLQILHRDADQGAGFHFTFFTLGSHDSHGYERVFVRVLQKILLARFEFQQVSFGKRSGRT